MDLAKSLEFFNPADVKERIHIVGCGSVGATIAEMLCRFGITKITLWDFDHVSSHNIHNQIFRFKDIGKLKVDALKEIITDINPDAANDIKLKPNGWHGENLSGIVFLAVDSIDLRRKIVEQHYNNIMIKAMFDVRTLFTGAQSFSADWTKEKMKKNLLNSMQFSDEDAESSVPVSACGVTLGLCPVVRTVCSLVVANFINFCKGKPLQKYFTIDSFGFFMESFE